VRKCASWPPGRVNLKANINSPKREQIYIIEYERSEANIDDPLWSSYSAPRHYKKSNALMVDNSVRLLSPEDSDPDKGLWRP